MKNFIKNKGFTLIELLVVIAIIGILASILIINLNSAKQKARYAKFSLEANQITLAMQLYYDKYGDWPDSFLGDGPGNYSGPLNPGGQGPQSLPLFVPEFYGNWNATYYCAGCYYYYQINDVNSDEKPDCGMIFIGGSVFTYRIPLCITSACGSSCGAKYP